MLIVSFSIYIYVFFFSFFMNAEAGYFFNLTHRASSAFTYVLYFFRFFLNAEAEIFCNLIHRASSLLLRLLLPAFTLVFPCSFLAS